MSRRRFQSLSCAPAAWCTMRLARSCCLDWWMSQQRYIFDASLITNFFSGRRQFHLIKEITDKQQLFDSASYAPRVQEVLSATKNAPNDSFTFMYDRGESYLTGAKISAAYAPVEKFVLQCARWNVLAERATPKIKRANHLTIGIGLPSHDTDISHCYSIFSTAVASLSADFSYQTRMMVLPSTSSAVSPGYYRFFKLHE